MAAHPASPAPGTPVRRPVPLDPGVELGVDPGIGPGLLPGLDLDLMEQEARRAVGEMPYAYYAGGAEDERLLGANVAAWSAMSLHPHVLVDVSHVSTSTQVLGAAIDLPVLVAPTAIQGLAHAEGEVATARGAAAAGTALILSSLATRPLEEVAAAAPEGLRWMQVYVLRDRGATAEVVRRAAAAGYRALVLTVDAPVSGRRVREVRGGVHLPEGSSLPNLGAATTEHAQGDGFMAVVARAFDPALTAADIGWLAGLTDLPVVVKGVLRPDDARRCIDAGAAAVAVSNHGGRQLDDAPATADVLAEVVDAVGGTAEVYVDGGLRRPGDVLKALALGARAVLLGRPVLWALATGGAEGVAQLLDWFGAELRRSMALCGAPTTADIDRSMVRRRPAAD